MSASYGAEGAIRIRLIMLQLYAVLIKKLLQV